MQDSLLTLSGDAESFQNRECVSAGKRNGCRLVLYVGCVLWNWVVFVVYNDLFCQLPIGKIFQNVSLDGIFLFLVEHYQDCNDTYIIIIIKENIICSCCH